MLIYQKRGTIIPYGDKVLEKCFFFGPSDTPYYEYCFLGTRRGKARRRYQKNILGKIEGIEYDNKSQ